MKMKLKYLIAAVVTIFIGYNTIFYNTMPEWYWMPIALSSIMWLFCFGIVEKAYKPQADMRFKKYPMTFIGANLVIISGILAIIQLILIVRN